MAPLFGPIAAAFWGVALSDAEDGMPVWITWSLIVSHVLVVWLKSRLTVVEDSVLDGNEVIDGSETDVEEEAPPEAEEVGSVLDDPSWPIAEDCELEDCEVGEAPETGEVGSALCEVPPSALLVASPVL